MNDAVVIGAGQNGLVAANLLADHGWQVLVLEEAEEPGGAVRSGELVEPGFISDMFSAFYPFTLASPHMGRMELERWGVRFRTGPVAVAHPSRDGRCPLIATDIERTAASLEEFGAGDGEAWKDLYRLWERVRSGALGAFFSPVPPVRPLLRLLRELDGPELARFTRFSLLPVRRLGEEIFSGEGGTRLLAGNALHADVSPEENLSGVFGWVLCSLGQQHGFPAVEGGAGLITRALVRRLESLGGRVLCGRRVREVECRGGAAVAVLCDEERFPAQRAVIADVGAPQLYCELLRGYRVSPRLLADMKRFQYDNGTVKVDWTLDAQIPWSAEGARQAGTVHIGETVNDLTRNAAEMACNQIPARPYLVMGQYSRVDPTRAPAGKETAWGYTHVPQKILGDAAGQLTGSWDERESELFADRMEERVEEVAPGFRSLIRRRHVYTPPSLERGNRNLVSGALNGGTARLHQQFVFRPLPNLGRPETPVQRLYLGSASIHPGGGVHGGPGANAAAAALAGASTWRPNLVGRMSAALQR